MQLFVPLIICVILALVFPKGFKYMVATWVGAAGGGFLWGLGATVMFVSGHPLSWTAMAWSGLATVVMGVVIGCVLAGRE